MKIYIVTILTVLLASPFAQAQKPNVSAEDRSKKRKEQSIFNEVTSTFLLWTESNKDSDRKKLQQAIDEALSVQNIKKKSGFTLAQIAYISGNYNKAVKILKEVIKKYPDQRVSGAMPMKITGRFFLASMHRQNGNYEQAEKVYKELRSNLNPEDERDRLVSAVCSLYLAEIASEYKGDKSLAVAELDKVCELKKPENSEGIGVFEFCCQWADFERTRLSKGSGPASKAISYNEDSESWLMFAVIIHPLMTGMCPDSMLPINVINAIQDRIFLYSNKTKKKSICTEGLLLYLGYSKRNISKYAKADVYYSDLFEKKSFLSPIAGFFLSESKEKQGKNAEADKILEKVSRRYPGYEKIVSKIKKQRTQSRQQSNPKKNE